MNRCERKHECLTDSKLLTALTLGAAVLIRIAARAELAPSTARRFLRNLVVEGRVVSSRGKSLRRGAAPLVYRLADENGTRRIGPCPRHPPKTTRGLNEMGTGNRDEVAASPAGTPCDDQGISAGDVSAQRCGPPVKRRNPFNSAPLTKRREPHTAIPGAAFRMLAR